MKKKYAEDVNYWKTGNSAPGVVLERARKEIDKTGGTVMASGEVSDGEGGSAYLLAFTLDNDSYKVSWPVLESRSKDVAAARRQAATMLFYDVKSRCVTAKVLGARVAFTAFLVLPGDQTVADFLGDTPVANLGKQFSVRGLLTEGKKSH